jgi:Tfp pilus assembly protein PilN
MSQQINLFNPIFLKQKKYFSAVTMVQALGLILAGSLLLGFYANLQLKELSVEAEAGKTKVEAAKAQQATVNATYGPRQKSKALETELAQAEAELMATQKVFETLKRGDFGNTKGYSEYLRAFSRQIVDGVWLTGFQINGAGAEMSIQGRALKPELVPAYINRLRREPVLQGKSFATLEIQAPKAETVAGKAGNAAGPQTQGGYIEFNLQSSEAARDQTDANGARSK